MSIFKDLSAVFFDWDGTLVDTAASSFLLINRFLEHAGKSSLQEKEYTNSPSISVRDMFRSMFAPHEYHEAVAQFRHFLEHNHHAPVPFSASHHLLSLLQQHRIPTGIVSNQYSDVLRKQIHHLGWEPYFCKIVGSGDLEHDKPSPFPLLHALEHIQIEPGKSVLFVGDSTVDMMCAEGAGCTPVSVGAQAEKFQGKFHAFKDIHNFYAVMKASMHNPLLGETSDDT